MVPDELRDRIPERLIGALRDRHSGMSRRDIVDEAFELLSTHLC